MNDINVLNIIIIFVIGPTFVRSDSILAADDDYVPYDSPSISKFGPISRMPKDGNGIGQSVSAAHRDGSMSSNMVSISNF